MTYFGLYHFNLDIVALLANRFLLLAQCASLEATRLVHKLALPEFQVEQLKDLEVVVFPP